MAPCMPLVDYSSSDSDSDGAPSPKRLKVVPTPAVATSTGDGDGDGVETRPKQPLKTELTVPPDPQPNSKPSLPKPKPRPKRALPTLPSSFAAAADTPHLHQGRRRARPFVDGDYYAHVYVELPVPRRLARVITDMVTAAGSGVHPILDRDERARSASASVPSVSASTWASPDASPSPTSTPNPPSPRCLHVSLSHPLPLRRSHLSTFPSDIAAALRPRTDSRASTSHTSTSASTSTAKSTTRFRLSLTPHPVTYRNTPGAAGLPGGRAFLALRVGAGARELARLLERVHAVLGRYHLPLYHADAEFHASVAWALCEGNGGAGVESGGEAGNDVGGTGSDEDGDGGRAKDGADGGREPAGPLGQGPGASIRLEPFPPDLVAELGRRFEAGLLAEQPRGGWEVSAVCVKVAKDVTRIPL